MVKQLRSPIQRRSSASGFLAVAIVLGFVLPAPASDEEAVRTALAKENYPWYDRQADAFQPVKPPAPLRNVGNRTGWGSFAWGDVGQFLVFILLVFSLLALIYWFARDWQQQLETAEVHLKRRGPGLSPTRTESLPNDLQVDTSDPLAAAQRLREQGDHVRSIVFLFAHQLLALSRLGLIRLAPGRTGRQLVRAIADPDLRPPVQTTLRLFEDLFYGHRDPDPGALEHVWNEAERFEQLIAERVALR